ncbi:MAG: type I secretion system permease/ATPase [Rhodospirillales bacterium]|jgi:PrtD family type I secretion system ABC transporter|nr:type I secretion system permease/ATPase [Rhodospirillales bacterium]
MTQPVQSRVLKSVMKSCGRAMVSVGVFSLFVNLLVLTIPLFMIQVFDRVLVSRSDDTLIVLSVAALMALGVMAMLELVRSRLLVRIGSWLNERLGPALMRALCDPSVRGGSRKARLHHDLSQVQGFLTGASVLAILDAPWIPVFLCVIFLLHPALGWIGVVGAMVLLGLAFANQFLARKPLKAAGKAQSEGLVFAEVAARQAETLSALGMRDALARRWSNFDALARGGFDTAGDRAGTLMALSRFSRLALQVIILSVAAGLVISQEISAGAMIAAAIILSRALAPVERAIDVWRGLNATRDALQRLASALMDEREDGQKDGLSMPLPQPRALVHIQGVSARAPGLAEPLFMGVSFKVRPGELVGITGPMGAGKSTLARMLVGVRKPDQGHVRLGSINVFAWDGDDLGPHVGYLPQTNELLPGTVGENIARFSDASPDAVIEAAREAGIHDIILALAKGYDTRVGPDGDPLAGGLVQRIGLARALFGNPRLVVLDEPYSNLDSDGIAALIEALENLKARGAATVIVSHRPSILAQADAVLILADGRARLARSRNESQLKLLSGGAEKLPLAIEDKPVKRISRRGGRK